jgi:hypothetical protein
VNTRLIGFKHTNSEELRGLAFRPLKREFFMTIERRSFPRYPLSCPVLVALPNEEPGSVYDARINNLSRTSIQIEGSADLVDALLAQTTAPACCSLQFSLPWYKHTFRIDASVLSHRALPEQRFALVLLLRHGDAQQETLLENQLKQQMPIGLH